MYFYAIANDVCMDLHIWTKNVYIWLQLQLQRENVIKIRGSMNFLHI